MAERKHIAGQNGTHDCNKPLSEQSVEAQLFSLDYRVTRLIKMANRLRCSCQADSAECRVLEDLIAYAAGLGLTDSPNILHQTKEERGG